MRIIGDKVEVDDHEKEVLLFAFKQGMREGASMKWPEMLFWMCLIVWLMNLATGGV